MIASLADALDAADIALKRYAVGNHRAPCPQCDRGPRDNALGVTLDEAGGFVAHCFRCGWRTAWHPRDAMPRPVKRAHEHDMHRRTLSPYYCDFWGECRTITANCIAGRYLIGRRCALPPNDVRWHARAWHPQQRRYFPAMVALVTDVRSGAPLTLHFTYLADNGSKAAIERPRLYLAGHQKAGGVVRLHVDDEVEQGLIVGEGLETCLSYALEFSPIWACLDAGNLGDFPVLPGIDGLTVLIDHDAAGERAFANVRTRYAAAGAEVVGVKSPVAGQDINDLAKAS